MAMPTSSLWLGLGRCSNTDPARFSLYLFYLRSQSLSEHHHLEFSFWLRLIGCCDAHGHRGCNQAIDAAPALVFCQLLVRGWVGLHHRIGRAHAQDRVLAVRNFPVEQSRFQIPQRRRHALEALTELHEVLLQVLFRETRLQEPGLEVPPVPAVERDLLDV